MPRFFFDTIDQGRLSRDDFGVELPDLDAVRRESVTGAREILAERIRHGEVLNGEEFWVRDEAGAVVLKFPLRSVVRGK